MSYERIDNQIYKTLPYCKEFITSNVYTPMTVEETKEMQNEQKVRIIGYLSSRNGNHYLKNIERLENNLQCELLLDLDLLDAQVAPALIPYPVQIFGSLVKTDSAATLRVKILHVISPRLAQIMSKQLHKIKSNHLCIFSEKSKVSQ